MIFKGKLNLYFPEDCEVWDKYAYLDVPILEPIEEYNEKLKEYEKELKKYNVWYKKNEEKIFFYLKKQKEEANSLRKIALKKYLEREEITFKQIEKQIKELDELS